MKTALDMLDRLEALARRIAKLSPLALPTIVDIIETANEIVAELPAPVDPLLLKAREIATRHSRTNYTCGNYDDGPLVQAILEALRTGISTATPSAQA